MPKATIRTYSSLKINGNEFKVTKIHSEQACVENIQKDITFLEKYSKRKLLRSKEQDVEMVK